MFSLWIVDYEKRHLITNLLLDVPRIPWNLSVEFKLREGISGGRHRHYRVNIAAALNFLVHVSRFISSGRVLINK